MNLDIEQIFKQEYDIAFVVAMEEELRSLLIQDTDLVSSADDLERIIKDEAILIGDARYIQFKLDTYDADGRLVKVNCLACLSGIGKVNAGSATAILLNSFKVDTIINFGFCGAVDEKDERGTVYVAQNVVYGDVNLQGYDYPYGQIPRQPVFFNMPQKFTQFLYTKGVQTTKLRYGTIITTDSFICNPTFKRNVLTAIKQSMDGQKLNSTLLGFDMECTAIAHVARAFGRPLLIFKEVSDSADSNAANSFSEVAYQNQTSALQNLMTFLNDSLPDIYHGIQVKRHKRLQARK